MISENTNLNIKLKKDKKQLFGNRTKSWNAEAEQKAQMSSIDMFKVVARSGEPIQSQKSLYGDYNLTESLIEMEKRINNQLTEQKKAVSMGDFKDKGATPTVSNNETVSKGELPF